MPDTKPPAICKNCKQNYGAHKLVFTIQWNGLWGALPKKVLLVKICPTAIWAP